MRPMQSMPRLPISLHSLAAVFSSVSPLAGRSILVRCLRRALLLRKDVLLGPRKSRSYPIGRIVAVFKADEVENESRYSILNDPPIRVCDEAGNVIETHEHAGDFKES